MQLKKIVLPDKDNYKIVAISDVHGHKEHLVRLMEQIDLKEDDYLIFVGDMINRGIDSYDVYGYMKTLVKRKNTYFLKGNHEFYIHHHLTVPNLAAGLLEFVKIGEYENILSSICKHYCVDLSILDSVESFQNYFMTQHGDVLDFIKNRPVLLEIDQFRFVHGGYETSFDIEREEAKFLKYDFYNEKTSRQDFTTIVGHWPACNIREDKISNLPYFNETKNLIFIDGGLGVKSTGELNALLIKKENGVVSYENRQFNDFKKARIRQKTALPLPSEATTFVNYPNYKIELIKESDALSRCLHQHSQIQFSVPNSLLVKDEEGVSLKMSYCNRFFDLEIGETVEICRREPLYTLVKYGDEFGWIGTEQIEQIEQIE